MPASEAVQAATLEKYLATWQDQDVEGTMALWSDDFEQRVLPLSLGAPTKSRAEAEFIYPKLVKSLSNWKLAINGVVHDAKRGTAAIYATSLGDTPLPGEKWTMEYGVFLSFSEDGTKINRLDEMMDTSFYQHLFPKLRKHLMEQRRPDVQAMSI